MALHSFRSSKGFTIVELIIVIAVIGILAAVGIVAYNGVTSNARDKSLLSDINGVASEITRYSTRNNGEYGSAVVWYSQGSANANIKFSPSAGNIIDVVANDTDYCIRAYNPASNKKTIFTAFTKGSSESACTLLAPSSAVLAANPVTNSAVVTTLAGSGVAGGVDGTGTTAQFDDPRGIAITPGGTIYVGELGNDSIRKITSEGVVTTLAGNINGTPSPKWGYVDGTGTAAKFWDPSGIALDSSGNLLVADASNCLIRKVTPAGVVTTYAGSTCGTTDGSLAAAKFNYPNSLVFDSSGNLFVADASNYRIRKITPGGTVTTFAGSTTGYTDATGTAAQFAFLDVDSLAFDANDNLFVTDTENNRIRKITPAGVVTTFAGSTSGFADGTGTAARFDYPRGITFINNDMYVVDSNNQRIRKITPAGVVTTFAGSGTAGFLDGTGTAARFYYPIGIEADLSGTLYVLSQDRVRKIQ